MNKIIITNNPLVRDAYKNIKYIDGTVDEVLIEVRNLVHRGHKIISHPLPGSIKMLCSPYKSVVISKNPEEIDTEHLIIVEEGIEKFYTHNKERRLDYTFGDGYKKLDFELLKSAFE